MKIKFRAKAIVNDKHNDIKVGDLVFGCYIESGCDAPCIIFGDGCQIEVDKNTVGQFIGLTDIEGDDIYSRDILHQLDPLMWNPFVVEYCEDTTCYLAGGTITSRTIKDTELKVIGDVDSNPELLKNPSHLQHEYEKHTDCNELHCHICEGGLLHCTVCGGFESSLTTECTGERLSDIDQTCVSNGDDYKNGKWHRIDIHS